MDTSYVFRLKAREALRSVEVLFKEESVPPEALLRVMYELKERVDLYVVALESESSKEQATDLDLDDLLASPSGSDE